MAIENCRMCGNEPGSFLVSETSTGDSTYVGLACFPPFVAAVWEDAGLPTLTFDVDVPDVPEPPPAPAETETEPPTKSRRKTTKTAPDPEAAVRADADGPELAQVSPSPADE